MLVSNVYGKQMWFLLSPCIDSDGEIVNGENGYGEDVEFDFKILEIIDKIAMSI